MVQEQDSKEEFHQRESKRPSLTTLIPTSNVHNAQHLILTSSKREELLCSSVKHVVQPEPVRL